MWYILHNRQEAFEFWGLGDGYMVAEGWNLIADTLKGVAEPATIYDKATGNGGAFGLIADKF